MISRRKACRLMSGVLLLTFFLSAETKATLVNYTDRNTWQTASGGGVGDIVDNLDSGSKVSGVIDRGTYTVTGNAINAFPNTNTSTTIDGTGYIRDLMASGADDYELFTFNSPIYALGFDVNPHSNSLGANLTVLIDGVQQGSFSLPATDVTGFRGFVSSVGFTTFEVRNNLVQAWHGIDNVEAYNVVPEPSVIALVCLFGSGLLGVRRFFLM